MTDLLTIAETSPLVLQLRPVLDMTADQFFDFCQINRDVQLERTATGDLIIMSPTGSETDQRNFNLLVELGIWVQKDGTGVGFGSSGGFTLQNGATRSPDAAWVQLSRWDALTPEQRSKFAPICPDFVVELRSPSDSLKPLQDKMQEYIDNGLRLGWLIDRKEQTVYVYRPDAPVEPLHQPETISGEAVLPGFVLELSKIW
jgi:Uma2 family endonuclease